MLVHNKRKRVSLQTVWRLNTDNIRHTGSSFCSAEREIPIISYVNKCVCSKEKKNVRPLDCPSVCLLIFSKLGLIGWRFGFAKWKFHWKCLLHFNGWNRRSRHHHQHHRHHHLILLLQRPIIIMYPNWCMAGMNMVRGLYLFSLSRSLKLHEYLLVPSGVRRLCGVRV